jgi:hypothetical protein
MPVRTINLKLILGNSSGAREARQALWTTHQEVNRAVARITQTLLLCRGEEYWMREADGSERIVPRAQVRQDALTFARAVQQRNASVPTAKTLEDDQVLALLRRLYEDLVPSCAVDAKGNPIEGDAQSANKWVSPMTDPHSTGNLSVFDKVLDPPPSWFASKSNDLPGWQAESERWLQTEAAQRLLRASGSPPSWIRKYRQNLPWQDALIADQEKKRLEISSGTAPLTKELREAALLPLFHSTEHTQLVPAPPERRIYDRLAMRLAVAHLLSWENWNHRTQKAHLAAKEMFRKVAEDCQPVQFAVARVRAYEAARHEELRRVALADDARPFRISDRTIRAWDRVRERWLQHGRTLVDRLKVLAELQTALRGKFGDPDLFRWLAADPQIDLWQQQDVISSVARLNRSERFLARRKPYSLMTLADPRFHPRWVMYEAIGGSNLRNYELVSGEDGVAVRFSLLTRDDAGVLVEKPFVIPLAPSAQLSQLQLIQEQKKGASTSIAYRSSHQQFTATLGGAELLLSRPYLQHPERSDVTLAGGSLGPAWLKLSLNVDYQAPTSWMRSNGKPDTPAAVHHFKTALSNPSKHADKLEPGLRVLSVDLGLRTFASCSVFELKLGRPSGGLFFPAADGRELDHPDKLWAVHERSFQLKLPGESPTVREKAARDAAFRPIRELRKDINHLRAILRLGVVSANDERARKLEELLLSLSQSVSTLSEQDLALLQKSAPSAADQEWQSLCLGVHQAAEEKVSRAFSQWRKETRPRPISWEDWHARRAYHGGKSIWMLEYIDSVRKLILSWNLRGRAYGQINRQDKAAWGTVACGLLEHWNNLKKDRTKSGADLIIQSARGLVPAASGAGWTQKYAPCRLILFEDLSRYRFRVDRPRRENSQLMKWTHREIIREATLQAEIYAIGVDTTEAGFSSRYLASSMQPGCRCRALTTNDFDGDIPKPYVVSELQDWPQITMRPGTVVPWAGGELFVTLGPSGEPHLVNADINAAQNLQRRFWGRCGDAYRIAGRNRELAGTHYVELVGPNSSNPDSIPARRLGALQQLEGWTLSQVLLQCPPSGWYRWGNLPGVRNRKLRRVAESQLDDELDLLDDQPPDEVTDSKGAQVVLFRDPAGLFFPADSWVEAKTYWGVVAHRTSTALATVSQNSRTTGDNDLPF